VSGEAPEGRETLNVGLWEVLRWVAGLSAASPRTRSFKIMVGLYAGVENPRLPPPACLGVATRTGTFPHGLEPRGSFFGFIGAAKAAPFQSVRGSLFGPTLVMEKHRKDGAPGLSQVSG
jgi:hypothetical protein